IRIVCNSFFFQAEDGIRDRNVTGVQTCALPISCSTEEEVKESTSEEKEEPKEVSEADIDDEVLQKVVDQSKKVESYHTSLDIDAELDGEEDETLNVEEIGRAHV